MYFRDRTEAGEKLADAIVPRYKDKDCAVIALSDGGVIVASALVAQLRCPLMMLLTEQINIPGEADTTIGSIDQSGIFTYNGMFSAGQLEEYTSEYHGYIEQQKLEKLHSMNRLLGSGGIIDPRLLRNKNVILVSDGLNNGMSLDSAAAYLKPYKLERLVIATPIASVPAVDRMHIVTDEICCLSTVDNFIETNHYYENNELPSHDYIVDTIKHLITKWDAN